MCEGIVCAGKLVDLFKQNGLDCPLFEQVAQVIAQRIMPKDAVLNLLCRPPKTEY